MYDNKPIFFSGARIPVHLQAATTATTLSTSRVRRGRGHVLDAANLQAATGERAKRGLTTRTRALRLVTTRRAHLNVKRGDTEFLASRRDVLRRKHRRVRGRFIAISLNLHTAGAAAEGFLARQIRDVLREGEISKSCQSRRSRAHRERVRKSQVIIPTDVPDVRARDSTPR